MGVKVTLMQGYLWLYLHVIKPIRQMKQTNLFLVKLHRLNRSTSKSII